MKYAILCSLIVCLLCSPTLGTCEIPATMSYQGVLTDDQGEPVEDGTYTMHFRIYPDASPGLMIWQETVQVQTTNGHFNISLGESTPLDLPFDEPYLLATQIEDSAELSPRILLKTSPYAFHARNLQLPFSGTASVDSMNPVFSVTNSNMSGGLAMKASSGNFGVQISAAHVGLDLTTGGSAIWIKEAGGQNTYGGHGIWIEQTSGEGIYIESAGSDGIQVDDALGFGVRARGTAGSGYFEGPLTVTDGTPLNGSGSGALIHVVGASNDPEAATIAVLRDGGATVRTTAAVNEGSIGTHNEKGFRLVTNNQVRMHIESDGNVGIGTTFPGTYRLSVAGDAFKSDGGENWATASDRRLKTNIQPIEPGILDRILQLEGHTFEYTDSAIEQQWGSPGRKIGFMAQDVQEIFPHWVKPDSNGYLHVAEQGTTAITVEAIRELRAEKDAAILKLESELRERDERISELENRMDELEQRLSQL